MLIIFVYRTYYIQILEFEDFQKHTPNQREEENITKVQLIFLLINQQVKLIRTVLTLGSRHYLN